MMSSGATGPQVFVDESKADRYILVAATVVPHDVQAGRQCVEALRHRGSSSIHMKGESDRTRKRIVAGLVDFGFRTLVVVADRGGRELDCRRSCLATVVHACVELDASRLVIERDDSVIKHDRQLLVQQSHQVAAGLKFQYAWMSRKEEPLLWVSDVVAWCYARGGIWGASVGPLISDVASATRL